jgi:hypothetical protein
MVRVLPLPTGTKLTPPGQFFEPVWWRLGEGCWLAGGAVVRWLEGAKDIGDGDYDLWGPQPSAITFPEMKRESELSTTYDVRGANVQVIKREYQSLEEVLESFDFTARMAGTDGKNLYVGLTTLKDMANKKIVRNPTGNFSINVTSLYGMLKYGNRGYRIDYGEARNMLSAWGVPDTLLKEGY